MTDYSHFGGQQISAIFLPTVDSGLLFFMSYWRDLYH